MIIGTDIAASLCHEKFNIQEDIQPRDCPAAERAAMKLLK